MRKHRLTLIGLCALLLWARALAAQHVVVPPKGGLPACQSVLSAAHLCGNGVIDTGELCDQSNLNGQTCASLGFLAGALQCGANCQFDTSGCTSTRFVDNGDGTVTDNETKLMWEQTTGTIGGTNTGKINDVNNTYTWVTAFTSFVATLNGVSDGSTITGCFANYCDWRLPSITELKGIVDYSAGACLAGTGACIDPIFGSTQFGSYPGYYWTGTTYNGNSDNAWSVNFGYGYSPYNRNKTSYYIYVRAVRSGS